MELLDQPLNVESARLNAPPKGANRLAGSGRLLVTWRELSCVSDLESGEEYHLAFYHPEFGWRACRWDEEHGAPYDVLPISERAVWVSTIAHKLIHFSVEDRVRATILASAKEDIFHLLYTTPDNLWIQEKQDNTIVQLCLREDGLTIVNEKFSLFHVGSMYPLADGAWMIEREYGCAIWSPSLLETVYERRGEISLHPPFIVKVGRKYCYYTEDPRRGWKKMPIAVESAIDHIALFAKHDNFYYAAVRMDLENRTLLYRFSGESEADAECMLEISGHFHPDRFAIYNGLLCIVDEKSLVVSGREDVPENHGFLAWNPRSNAFYNDIPQFSIMHARHAIPHNLQIPTTWSDKENERMSYTYKVLDKRLL